MVSKGFQPVNGLGALDSPPQGRGQGHPGVMCVISRIISRILYCMGMGMGIISTVLSQPWLSGPQRRTGSPHALPCAGRDPSVDRVTPRGGGGVPLAIGGAVGFWPRHIKNSTLARSYRARTAAGRPNPHASPEGMWRGGVAATCSRGARGDYPTCGYVEVEPSSIFRSWGFRALRIDQCCPPSVKRLDGATGRTVLSRTVRPIRPEDVKALSNRPFEAGQQPNGQRRSVRRSRSRVIL